MITPAINTTDVRDLPAGVRLGQGSGGLPCVFVETERAVAQLYLHGAHMAHFQPCGHDAVLWMSGASHFAAGRAIRGGVPICFPWFGARSDGGPGPAHGFARLREWSLLGASVEGDALCVRLGLASDDETINLWPHAFALEYLVTIGDALTLELRVKNTGHEPFQFEEALHSYFAVSDIAGVSVSGLENAPYIDKVADFQEKIEGGEPVRIIGETDRVFTDHRAACVLHDPGFKRRIAVAKSGSATTVLWNPWVDKARAMPDFGDEEWPRMLCIETANAAGNALTLQPGEERSMRARIEVQQPA